MNNQNKEQEKPVDNMALLKEQSSSCGSDCACHSAEPAGRMRWVLGLIILVAAFALVARAVVKNKEASRDKAAAGFATLAVPGQTHVTEGATAPSNTEAIKEIGALSDLSAVAADMAGVFIFVPGKAEATDKGLMEQILAAAKIVKPSKNSKVGVFILKAGSPDYQKISAQSTLPCVLAMVKGGGMAPVSGDISETSLVQAFIAASGCGPGGCGPGGCK